MVLAQKQMYRSIKINRQNKQLKINPHSLDRLIYNKGSKNLQWGKDRLFSNLCWENWTATYKRIN